MSVFSDHFAKVAADYAAHRPTYPEELFRWLASAVPSRNLVWDCATGTGQAAVGLAGQFKQVWATDASASQIEAAVQAVNITYQTAPANVSGLPDSSADLVTVAQALHWFDLEPFYGEVRRVLKPGGLLVVWTYGIFRAEGVDATAVQSLLDQFYHQTVGPFWPAERRHVEDGYAGLPFPFHEVPTPAYGMAVSWNLCDLAGYLRSWSATSRFKDQQGFDPVEPLVEQLEPLWGSERKRVIWPLSIKAGLR